jgi:PKD repeat protein
MNLNSFFLPPAKFILASACFINLLSPGFSNENYSYNLDGASYIDKEYSSSSAYLPQQDTLKIKMCAVSQATESTGLFYDSGGPEGNYNNSQYCTFLIHTSCADSIRLIFKSFYTEACCDGMMIYQGANTSGILLNIIQGSVFPSQIVAKGSEMFIVFYSDGSVNHSGWEAYWESFVPPGAPPVADFQISDINPPLLSNVFFTDQSTNNPGEWFWDFGDSTTSNLQNPSHAYKSSGDFLITLIADNCFYKDTVSKTLTVQPPPVIDIFQDTLSYDAYTCFDSADVMLNILNKGSGYLIYSISNGPSAYTDMISTKYYSGYGDSTKHIFSDLNRESDSLYLEITISGDFNSSSEYASLYIDGNLIGQVDDRNLPIGTNITVKYSFGPPEVPLWISDGRIKIELRNSISVGTDPMRLHQVRLLIPKPGWTCIPYPDGVIPMDDTIQIPIIFNWQLLNSGIYTSEIEISSNDTMNPQISIPCVLKVDGYPEVILSDTAVNFDNVRILTSKRSQVWIYNAGCDTLFIEKISNNLNEFGSDTIQPVIFPGDSSMLGIYFNPELMIEYRDTIEIQTNIGIYQILISGKGEGIPVAVIYPDSLSVTLTSCEDSSCHELKIYNQGEGTLHYNLSLDESGVLMGIRSIDDFEDGNLNGWTVESGASAEIITDAAKGNYAMKLTGGSWSNGISYSFNPDTITYFSYYFKFIGTGFPGGFNLRVADIFLNYFLAMQYYSSNDSIGKLNLNGTELDFTLRNFNWYFIEVRNISFQEKKFDFYIDGKLIKENIDFINDLTSNISCLYLNNEFEVSSTYFDHFRMGNNTPREWITVSPESDVVSPGDSSFVTLCISGNGLVSTKHKADLLINTDDPLNPDKSVPVSVELFGLPEIQISDTLINFDTTRQWQPVRDTLIIENRGCDTLFIHEWNLSSSSFSADSMYAIIYPGDRNAYCINFIPDTTGYINGNLEIKSNGGDVSVHLTGFAEPSPSLSIEPDTLKALFTLSYDSVVVPLIIENTGGAEAYITISEYNPLKRLNVLALTYGVDLDEEYQHTLEAINLYFTEYNLKEVYIDDATVLQGELKDQDVLLIAEQESGSGSVFSGFASVLNNYVNSGGIIIFCGTSRSSCIFNTGLFSGSSYTSVGSDIWLDVMNLNHPVMENLPLQISSTNATYAYNFTNPDKVTLVKYSTINWDIVTLRQIGKGYVLYAGFDYYLYNYETARIISNAIKWAGRMRTPDWFRISPDSCAVPPDSTRNLNATFYSLNLIGGEYENNLIISTNDPRREIVEIPVRLTIKGTPVMFIPDSSISFGVTKKFDFVPRLLTIYNKGNGILKIDSISTSTGLFRIDTIASEIPPFDSSMIWIEYHPDIVGVHEDTLHIYTNAGHGLISLTGACEGIPEIKVEPESITEYLQEGDSVIVPLKISNIGDDTLVASLTLNWWGLDTSWAFIENFDDGNYDGWLLDGSNHFVIFTQEDSTGLNARVIGGYDELLKGFWKPLHPFNESYISIKIKPSETIEHAYFAAAGDSSLPDDCMFILKFMGDGYISLFADSGHYCNYPYSPGNWYNFEFRNIDFINKKFDFYIDKKLIGNEFPFINKDLESITRLILYNPESLYADYDDIYMGETPLENFISISSDKLSLYPGQEEIIDVLIRSEGIRTGSYESDLIITSNDPHRPEFWVPCILNVVGVPMAEFKYQQEGCSGNVYFYDYSMNFPESWIWDFGDGYESNSQYTSHYYSEPGTYTVSLKVCNELGCDTTYQSVILSMVNGPKQSGCIPGVMEQSPVATITGVKFNTIENYINDLFSWYEDFTCMCHTEVKENETYKLTVYADSFSTRAWIDYNNDGWYNEDEMIMDSPELYVHERTSSVTIPAEAVKKIPLRMRVVTGVSPWEVTGNCDSIYVGQVEDYSVTIIPAVVPPIAKYEYNVVDECRGEVHFWDKSDNEPFYWLWRFGDGTEDTIREPVHHYVQPGEYQVKLIVSNEAGTDSITHAFYLHSLTSEIHYDSALIAGDSIQFNYLGLGANSWAWDFGDGDSAFIRSPYHIYESGGQYVIKLTASNDYGCGMTISKDISVAPSIDRIDNEHFRGLNIFPNPTNDKLNIMMYKLTNEELVIDLLDPTGRVIFNSSINGTGEVLREIDVSDYAAGIYLLRIWNSDLILSRIILIE